DLEATLSGLEFVSARVLLALRTLDAPFGEVEGVHPETARRELDAMAPGTGSDVDDVRRGRDAEVCQERIDLRAGEALPDRLGAERCLAVCGLDHTVVVLFACSMGFLHGEPNDTPNGAWTRLASPGPI